MKNDSPNAQGPNNIHCRKCGGLVPLRDEGGDGIYSLDPVRNAIEKERDEQAIARGESRGVKRTFQTLKGGL